MVEADRQARFERVARDLGADLLRYALWLCGHEALAKDLVQETFLRAWKALDSLRSEAAAKSWLITILRREYARTFERKVPPLTDSQRRIGIMAMKKSPSTSSRAAGSRASIVRAPSQAAGIAGML